MQVLVADNPAFCYGVERAYALVKKHAAQRVYTWGPLIHNPQIVNELENLGIFAVDDLNQLKVGDTVILRAHGVSDRMRQQIKSKGVNLIDGSCPFVTKAHVIARRFVQEGKKLVIIGDQNHPEIRGIYEDFPDAIVIKNIDAVETCHWQVSTAAYGIICQTTIKQHEVDSILDQMQQKGVNFTFENTICNATHSKQTSAKELAQKVDVMLVVGGQNSNNTKMLHQICQQYCPSYLVSEIDEIQFKWFENVKTVGLTGGASTPLWLIKAVKSELEKFFNALK